jgi:hypothetical protein
MAGHPLPVQIRIGIIARLTLENKPPVAPRLAKVAGKEWRLDVYAEPCEGLKPLCQPLAAPRECPVSITGNL